MSPVAIESGEAKLPRFGVDIGECPRFCSPTEQARRKGGPVPLAISESQFDPPAAVRGGYGPVVRVEPFRAVAEDRETEARDFEPRYARCDVF